MWFSHSTCRSLCSSITFVVLEDTICSLCFNIFKVMVFCKLLYMFMADLYVFKLVRFLISGPNMKFLISVPIWDSNFKNIPDSYFPDSSEAWFLIIPFATLLIKHQYIWRDISKKRDVIFKKSCKVLHCVRDTFICNMVFNCRMLYYVKDKSP